MTTIKFCIGFAVLAVLFVQVQTKRRHKEEEEEFKCSTFHNDTYFDLLILQNAAEECVPRKIVNPCKCPRPNQLRWTKCLLKKLKLKKPDRPHVNQCTSLKYLSNLLKCYNNRGKVNCPQ